MHNGGREILDNTGKDNDATRMAKALLGVLREAGKELLFWS